MPPKPQPASAEALLLIDFQVDFLNATGRMPAHQGQVEALLKAAHTAVHRARADSCPIVAIGNEFRRGDWLNLFRNFASIEGSSGAAWDPRAPAGWDVYFAKQAASAFSNPKLEPWLTTRHVRRLHLLGVFAYGCVAATARAALRRGFEVVLVADGIACRNDASLQRNLAKLVRAGASCRPALG